MKSEIVLRGGHRKAAIGGSLGGMLCGAFFSLIDGFGGFALVLFLSSAVIGLLGILDSYMPMVRINREKLWLYTGFLKRAPTIYLDLFNIDSLGMAERDRKIRVRTGLSIGGIPGVISEEVLVLRLKAPPEVSCLNRLRTTRDSGCGFCKYALGESDREVLIRIPPNGGFKNLLQMVSDNLEVLKGQRG